MKRFVLERIEATEGELDCSNSVLAPHEESAPRVVFSIGVLRAARCAPACSHTNYCWFLITSGHHALFEEPMPEDVNSVRSRMLVGLLREESLPVQAPISYSART